MPSLFAKKERGEKISWLTCYDFPFAQLMDQAGVEMILVGDSAAMTVHGHKGTLPITMDEMISHSKAVVRGAPHCFVIGDMPFMSYQISVEEAIRNAGRFMKEGGCDAIKLEGGRRVTPMVRGIVDAGIPVIGHIGLTPQSSSMLGGARIQGKTAASARALVDDAKALAEAGAFAILLELIPTPVSDAIMKAVPDLLIFGIGAGPVCHGQLVIMHDLIGLFQAFQPKFVKKYVNISEIVERAFEQYVREVKDRTFPAKENEYEIDPKEIGKLKKMLKKA
ncbi:MAG: 3-methyl-2-oxobutanoate hydroxymethyltransferase [Deltaproteobacteria bacterium]|nr:3-methyl-2-oxobutanoate hydroxymethyltransferase [Deltaproteobacteria bacterium]